MAMSSAKSGLDQHQSITFLALGDSYTIGEGVDRNDSWPCQLTGELNKEGFAIHAPEIIAKTGWTTDELQSSIEKAGLQESYDLVSLLIGVNNQYRKYALHQYDREFKALLERAINLAGGVPENVLVISIPDYGATPFGQSKRPEKISEEIDRYNDIAKRHALSKGAHHINITPLSKKALHDRSLVAGDELHPSAKMYALWVQKILPAAIEALN